nr:MAG TPA: hypothetical protein [Caudoviricetes sp.]
MLKPLQRQGKGRALNSFQRLSNLSFLPCNMRKQTACALKRKGIHQQQARVG